MGDYLGIPSAVNLDVQIVSRIMAWNWKSESQVPIPVGFFIYAYAQNTIGKGMNSPSLPPSYGLISKSKSLLSPKIKSYNLKIFLALNYLQWVDKP